MWIKFERVVWLSAVAALLGAGVHYFLRAVAIARLDNRDERC
jgi:hypothetical protein